MKRASYREACRWVAANDSAGEDDAFVPEEVGHLVTSLLVADLFGVPSERVGRDVVRARRQLFQREGWRITAAQQARQEPP